MATQRSNSGELDAHRLRGNLDRLEGDGRWFLQRWKLREALHSAAGSALLSLCAFPLLLLLAQLTRGLLGAGRGSYSLWIIAGLALLGPVLYIAARLAVVYYRYHPRRSNALALYDEELRTHDRLVTADEFLDTELSGGRDLAVGFKQAAVSDADDYARSALTAALSPLASSGWRVRPVSWLGVAAAVVIALLLQLRFDGVGPADKAIDKALLDALAVSVDPHATQEQRAAARQLARRLELQKKEQQLAALEKQEAAPAKDRKSRQDKGMEGSSNAGASTVAQSSSTSNNAAGEPSSQKNASKPKKPEEEKPEEPDTKNDPKKSKKKEQKKAAQMAMSATSGEGKMSMSASSPSEFDLPEEEDRATSGSKQGGADEETEDEDEQEKSNNTTKPAVKKTLRASPDKRLQAMALVGDGPPNDKDSNGRSGPHARKKTRGVPSMILGIPIHDRVQGMPNPGRSKVTQEDAKPTEEFHPALEAQLRLARTDMFGHVQHPRLLPWMRMLIQEYFVALRKTRDTQSAEIGAAQDVRGKAESVMAPRFAAKH